LRRVSRELPSGPQVAPSILAADFSRLGAQVAEVMDAGARVIHVDVMDGHFVPPITMGPLVVEALREQVHDADGWIDVHLMIERPERHVMAFADAGADSVTVHFEATPHVHYAVKEIRGAGLHAGVALTPSTPPEALTSIDVDIALCMTVNPGWGGQAYIEGSERKVARLRELLPDSTRIEVDGGIDLETAPRCAEAGASLFVAGSHVMGTTHPGEAYRRLAGTLQ
jgi:ribulose-phosphate 3-epimerase